MVVNSLPFLTTFSRDIIFGTADHVTYRTAKQLADSLMKIFKLYAEGSFVVLNVLIYGEFDKFKPEISLIELKISAAREHVA